MNSPTQTSPIPSTKNDTNPHHIATSCALSLENRYCPSYMTASTNSADNEGCDDDGLNTPPISSSVRFVNTKLAFLDIFSPLSLLSTNRNFPLSKSSRTIGWTAPPFTDILPSERRRGRSRNKNTTIQSIHFGK